MKTKEDCKNEIADNNNFDSFKMAIRYTFNRELLESEQIFINKIIDESMDCFAKNEACTFAEWCSWNDYEFINKKLGRWNKNHSVPKIIKTTEELYAMFLQAEPTRTTPG